MELLTDTNPVSVASPVLLIANPASRRGGPLLARARAAFAAAGVECEALLTERPGHAAEMVEAVAEGRGTRYGAVFTLGGDGTAM